MKKSIIFNLFLFIIFLGKNAWATEAWSIVSNACTIWTVGGSVDNATHNVDTSPAYGLYTTVDLSVNNDAYLFCPVWLPHGSYIDTLKFRYFDNSTDTYITVNLFKQRVIYGTTEPGADDYFLLTSCTSEDKTVPAIKTCTFTREKVCNYNDGVSPCNDDKNIFLYYVQIRIHGYPEKPLPKIYSIWVSDPPMSTSEFYENYSEPIDCGLAIDRYNVGLEISEKEKECFFFYGISIK